MSKKTILGLDLGTNSILNEKVAQCSWAAKKSNSQKLLIKFEFIITTNQKVINVGS